VSTREVPNINLEKEGPMQENINNVTPIISPIRIDNKMLVINNWRISNAELVEYLASKQDMERAFLDLIDAALLVRRLSDVAIEAEALNSVADRVTGSVEKAGLTAVDDFTSLIEKHTNIEDPSGLARILVDQLVPAIAAELSPLNKKGPMFKIYDPLIDLVQRIAGQDGAQDAVNKSSTKGKNFNATMDGIPQHFASQSGDQIEFVNDVKSVKGLKGGDEIITIPTELTGGQSIKIVWEFKAERDLSQPAILKELASAIDNRQAQAGVFVLAMEPEYEKWSSHSFASGNRLLILVDKEDPDKYLIQFAYLWSRMVALKNLSSAKDTFDVEKMQYLFDQAEVSLKDFRNIKTAHTGIETSLTDARRWVTNVENSLKQKFAEISEELAGNDGFDEIVSTLAKKKKA
jgi:hypothetical protein